MNATEIQLSETDTAFVKAYVTSWGYSPGAYTWSPDETTEPYDIDGLRAAVEEIASEHGTTVEALTDSLMRVPTDEDVANAVERAKREILADIADGAVPADVRDFSALHDYVDANEYGGLCEPGADFIQWGGPNTERTIEVQDALHAWLQAGHPEPSPAEAIIRRTVVAYDAQARAYRAATPPEQLADLEPGLVMCEMNDLAVERGFIPEGMDPDDVEHDLFDAAERWIASYTASGGR